MLKVNFLATCASHPLRDSLSVATTLLLVLRTLFIFRGAQAAKPERLGSVQVMAGEAQDESVEVGDFEVWGLYVVEALFLGHLVGVLRKVFVVSHIKGACLDGGGPGVLGIAVGEVVF